MLGRLDDYYVWVLKKLGNIDTKEGWNKPSFLFILSIKNIRWT